jgi:hypothetical protein
MASRHENVYFDYPGPSMFMPMDIAKKLHNKPGTIYLRCIYVFSQINLLFITAIIVTFDTFPAASLHIFYQLHW